MEPVIVNSYTQTKALTRDFFKYTFFYSPFMRICDVLIVIGFAVCMKQLIFEHTTVSTMWLFPAILIAQVAAFYKTSSLTYEKTVAANGGREIVITVEVGEEGVHVLNEKGPVADFGWSQLLAAAFSKNLCLLTIGGGRSVVLSRDGFTKGSAAELASLAKEKGVKIRGKI